MNKAQLIASRLLESDEVDDVFNMLTGREYLHTLLKSMRFVITGEDARWKAVLQLPEHNMAIQVTPAEQIMWRGLVTDPEGYVRVGYLNRNGDEWVGRTLAEDELALYLDDALKRINSGDYRLPYEKLTRYKFRKPRTPEEKERQAAYWRNQQQKGNEVAEALLETFDKDDLEFWGGQDHVRRTLQQEGWSYRPPGNFTTWTVYRNVRMRNGNTVEVRVHPRRSHRAWFVSVWDPDNEHQHYWTVPNVHDDRVIDAAREVVDTLETWRDDNLAHVPIESQLSIALEQSFERYTRREEPQLGEGLRDDIDDLAGVDAIMRDLSRLGWRIEDDPDPGPYRVWRAYKDFAWRNIEKNGHQWVAASLHPVYNAPGNDRDPGSYIIELHQERNTTPVAGISPFRVVHYAEWMDELFASTDYDPKLSPVSNLDRTLGPVFAHMKAVTGKDMWESEDIKDFVLSSHWDSDPEVTLKHLGFDDSKASNKDERLKIIQLKHPVPWSGERYHSPDTPAEMRKGMIEVALAVERAHNWRPSDNDPEQPRYWDMSVKRSVSVGEVAYGWNNTISLLAHHARDVYASQKLGDLSTRLETVITALEQAVKQADNGTQYKNQYDFFNAVNRYWGKQPNRIVRPYTRRKKQQGSRPKPTALQDEKQARTDRA